MSELIQRAKYFAIAAHSAIDQRRKYTNEPYYAHCATVALHVASVGGTQEMVAAAWLHDTVEDTKVTLETIEELFGWHVMHYVSELTDVETGNRKERKAKARERLANASDGAQTIKLADLIDNTRTIEAYDPEFAKVYMKEKGDLMDVMIRGNQSLWMLAKLQIDAYYERNRE